jgi:hypothetical protein
MIAVSHVVSSLLLLCAALYWLPWAEATSPPTRRRDHAWRWRHSLITAPLFALSMSLYLFVATPAILRWLGEDLPTEPIVLYLAAAWPAALLAVWIADLLVVVPGLVAVVRDIQVMAFVAAIPVMVVLYTHEGVLEALTGSVFVVLLHPAAVGTALITLKATSAIRTWMARRLACFTASVSPKTAGWTTEARLGAVLAPLFFVPPILVFFVFTYHVHLASGLSR